MIGQGIEYTIFGVNPEDYRQSVHAGESVYETAILEREKSYTLLSDIEKSEIDIKKRKDLMNKITGYAAIAGGAVVLILFLKTL